jgi:sugar phosphate permease
MSPVASLPNRVRGIFYGWWLVPITGLVRVLTSVPLFHAMTIWSVALESQFGWSRTQLSLAFAFTRIEGGIMGPVEGYLTDRLGTRRMVLIGLLVLGVGFLFFWQVRYLWMFYLAFVVMSLGHSLAGWVPVTAVLNNWFARRRATAMGWSNTISRLGGLLMVPAIAWAIDPDQERLGWQLTALILGIFALAIALPLSRLIRNRPEEYNMLPDGEPPTSPTATAAPREGLTIPKGNASSAATDLTTAQALRTPAFWFISLGHGFTSMVIIAIMAHLGLFMKDQGSDVQTTAWVVSVYSAISMVFQLVGGYMGDRVPARLAIFLFTTVQAGSVVLLTFAATIPAVYLFAILFGIGFGGRNPLTTAIRGDYFGRASFGKILGISTVPMNILLLIAAPFAGYMYDLQGTYTMAFLVLAGLNFLGGVLFLMAKKPVLMPSLQRGQVSNRMA